MSNLSTLAGVSFVITGAIPGYGRRDDFAAELTTVGAHWQKSITGATDLLIVGEKPGADKLSKAKANGVETIPWTAARDLLNNGGSAPAAPAATTPAAEVTPPPKRNAPAKTARQVVPMLCLKADELPANREGWIYEVKWDGWRLVAHGDSDGVVLASRNGKDLSQYTPIIEELSLLDNAMPFILDGELVCVDEHGNSSIERLQKATVEETKFVVFDVLELLGNDTRKKPLHERRELLHVLLDQLKSKGGGQHVIESPTFDPVECEQLLDYAREHDLEGIVAKQAASHYREGTGRPGTWLKIKLRPGQEFVVVGFTPGKGARAGVPGSALLAVNDGTKTNPKWVFCGQVGTGGTNDDWAELQAAATESPAHVFLPPEYARVRTSFTAAELKAITWVEPTVVVQVEFQRWTEAGVLYHTSMQGQRHDKHPKEVKRET